MRAALIWLFVGGFAFLIGVGAWTIVTVTRLQRRQAVAVATLNAMAAKLGLQREGDHLEAGKAPAVGRGSAQ